jgi:hypothetical protein
VDRAGGVVCVGRSDEGQLPRAAREQPIAIGGLAKIEQLSLGYAHGCARSGASAWCWGYGALGQLGNGGKTSTSPIAVPLKDIVDVDAGHVATCARTVDGTVSCWGMLAGSFDAQRDRRIQNVALAGKAIDLDVHGADACVVLESGSVQCWTDGVVRTIGNVPPARSVAVRDPGEGCALTETGALWCWSGTKAVEVTTLATPIEQVTASCVLTRAGEVACWGGARTCGPSTRGKPQRARPRGLIKLAFPEPIVSIHVGPYLVCGRTSDDTYYCQGCRASGDALPRPTKLSMEVAACRT